MSAPQTMQDDRIISPDLREALDQVGELCTDCGLCRDECGFLLRYGTPKQIARDYDPASDEWMRRPFECCLCRLCRAVCPEGVAPDKLFLKMRREAVERGVAPFPKHARLLAYERTGFSRRFTFYGLPAGCATVLFPGCALTGTRPERTRQIFETLRQNDSRLGIVLDCCGRISHDLGREAFTHAMFEEMRTYLTGHGVRDVIVACPNCYDMFRDYGKGLRVRTVYEALPAEEFSSSCEQGEVVLHDPCGTRFHPGCQTAVRALLTETGFKIRDMDHAREKTLCCGSGAGIEAVAPDLARQWLKRVTGPAQANTLATYCAGCQQRMHSTAWTVHALDLLYDPTAALSGKPMGARAPLTYLNRLRLKRFFRRNVAAAAARERTFWAGAKTTGPWGRLLLLAALIALIIAARFSGLMEYLDQERLRGLIQLSGFLAPLIYMLGYTIAPALLLPGLPFTILGGILFGPFWGVIYAITGATAGACLAFLIARYAARGWVEDKLKNARLKRLDAEVERQGWKIVAFTRLVPLFPFNLLNYAFGLTSIGFIPYAVTSLICMLPACIAYIVFSSSLIDLLQGRVSASLLIGIALIALVALIPVGYRTFKNKRNQ
ncbi:MAG: VTT domain-containing protein [Syntrophaceae bacterium]